jgi:hypothetical protein
LARTGALICATLFGGVLLSGCSGGSSAESGAEDPVATGDDSTSTVTQEASGQEPDEVSDASADDLPDGFPDDVPLPGYSSAKELGTPSGPLEAWSVLLKTSPRTETPVEDYAALLEDEGYTVESGPGESMDAEGSDWDVTFHSSLSGTVSITVMES